MHEASGYYPRFSLAASTHPYFIGVGTVLAVVGTFVVAGGNLALLLVPAAFTAGWSTAWSP
jgi:hypothetical protein